MVHSVCPRLYQHISTAMVHQCALMICISRYTAMVHQCALIVSAYILLWYTSVPSLYQHTYCYGTPVCPHCISRYTAMVHQCALICISIYTAMWQYKVVISHLSSSKPHNDPDLAYFKHSSSYSPRFTWKTNEDPIALRVITRKKAKVEGTTACYGTITCNICEPKLVVFI